MVFDDDWAVYEALSMTKYDDFDRSEGLLAETIKYFTYCPIYGNDETDINVGEGGKDTINCDRCGAKWHIYFGFFDKQLK